MSLLYCIYYRPTQTLADYVARDKWRYKDNITIMITLLKVAQTPTQKIQKMSSSSNDVNTLQCHCLFTSFKLLDIFCILRVDVLCTAVHERILRQYILQQVYIWNHIRAYTTQNHPNCRVILHHYGRPFFASARAYRARCLLPARVP